VASSALVGLSAAQANAAIGTQHGALSISPASGPTSTPASSLTYSTSMACPLGHQGSGLLQIVDPGGGGFNNMTPVNNAVTSPFSGTFNSSFALAIQVFPDLPGKTAELVIQCYTGPSATGTSIAVQDTFVTFAAAGANYSTSASGGPTATSTESTAPPGGDTIPIGVTVTSGTSGTSGTSATATPTAAPATGGGTGPGSNLALAAAGAAVVLTGGGLILLAGRRPRKGADIPSGGP